ncbi:SCO3242 family prenyltransferase [Streptomyces griseorubiginosus]|uniref:SCO3242 family prenyltransferase n=1 Tax=Streptomyces griseorubiginosus TaxID=67304 RepID=UPI001AD7C765|nr:UbiA family prenyltransferase [Streptomyces griseorubiginosus]MBO4260728.1 prenyltransferase [Streptomyces griseorubiginosus]
MKERRRLWDLALLVRAPAALSVPGDVLAGAAAAGDPLNFRVFGAMSSSMCLYWAGMALNDYADATIDAVERPERPVPSGRVPRRTALAVAGGLTAAGLGLAAATGGRRGLLGAGPLAGLIWAYDLGLKNTPAGAATMAGARILDVLTGALAASPAQRAGTALRKGAGPAALVGAHTYTLMALSRHEIHGAPARLPARTLAASAALAVAAAAPTVREAAREIRRSARPVPQRGAALRRPALPLQGVPVSAPALAPDTGTALVTAGAVLGYLGTYGTAQLRALRKPSGENVRRAVGAGILALMPLQAALTARAGAPAAAAVLGVGHPLARRFARRMSPT